MTCDGCGDPILPGQRWKRKVNDPDSSLRLVSMTFHLGCFLPDGEAILERGQRW